MIDPQIKNYDYVLEYSARLNEFRGMDESTIRPSQEFARTQLVANPPIRITESSTQQKFDIAPFVLNFSCGSLIPHFFDTASAAVALAYSFCGTQDTPFCWGTRTQKIVSQNCALKERI